MITIPLDKYLYFGKGSKIYPNSVIIDPEKLFIDDFAVISDFCFIYSGEYTQLGKYSNCAPFSLISGGGKTYIGNFSEISYGVRIITGSDDIYGPYLFTPGVPAAYRNVSRSTVEIGDYCVIGTNSIIFPGVKIGEGVIVRPGAIIKENLKAWHIYETSDTNCLGIRKNKDEIIEKSKEIL